MEYIYFSVLAWVVLFLLGLPICLVVLPKKLHRYLLVIAPSFGFASTIFFCYYLFRLNIGGTDRYAFTVLSLAIIATGVLILKSNDSRESLRASFCADGLLALIIGLFAFAVCSAPFYITASGRALAAAMSNLDVVELAVNSRFIQEFVPNSNTGFLGQTGHLKWTCEDVWFGPSAIVAFVGSIVQGHAYQLQMLVMSLIATQTSPLVYVFSRKILKVGPLGSATCALIYGVSPVPLFTIWQSFGGQMLSITLMAIALVIAIDFEDGPVPRRGGRATLLQHYRVWLSLAILLTGIILSYHYMVLILTMLMIAYAVSQWLFDSDYTALTKRLIVYFACLTVCVALNPLRMTAFFRSLEMLNSGNGWFIPWIGPDTIGGIGAANMFAGMGDPINRIVWIILATLPIFAGFLAIGLLKGGDKKHKAILLGILLPTLMVGLWYGYSEQQGGLWGSYRSFKITASFSFLVVLGTAAGFRFWHQKFPRAITGSAVVYALWFFYSATTNSQMLNRFTQNHAFLPDESIQVLQTLESMPFVDGLNVADSDNFSLMWTNYFTLGKHQIYQRFPYGGRPVGTANQSYTLSQNHDLPSNLKSSAIIFAVEPTSYSERHPIGPRFFLFKPESNENVLIAPAEGWWPAEPTHQWSGNGGPSCSVYIDCNGPSAQVFVEATYSEIPEDRNISVSLNGVPVQVECGRQGLRTVSFLLERGRNILTFTTNTLPAPPSEWDPRTLNIAWTSVMVRFDQ